MEPQRMDTAHRLHACTGAGTRINPRGVAGHLVRPSPGDTTQSLRIEHYAVPKRLMMLVRVFWERQHIFKLFPETRSG